MKKVNIGVLLIIFNCLLINFAFFSTPIFNFGEVLNAEDVKSMAKSMVVIEKTSGRVLYNKNENEKLPMASLTKIITAIYVISTFEDLDNEYEIPKEAVGIEGTSIGLKAGEHLTIRELLYGLMLRSGNDSAVALAILTEGSETQFVEKVNVWLKNNGFLNTQIRNPHGLHHEEHFTTACDLAKITAFALNNQTFQEIVACKEIKINNELNSKTSRNLKNKNRLLRDFIYADGVKTGYTKKAGRCFVGSATKDGMQLICVLLNCVPMFEESQDLLLKAFEEYKMEKILASGDLIGSVKIKDATLDKLVVSVPNDVYYPLRKGEYKDLIVKFIPNKNLKAPIKIGDELASIEITFKNQLIFSDKIYSIKYIGANTFNSKFERIIENM